MKKFYILFVLLNVLVMGSKVNAQMFCNPDYHFDTIAYNPAPFNVGTDVSFLDPDTIMSSLIPIGFTFNFYGNNYSEIVSSPLGFITFNSNLANQHPVANAFDFAEVGLPTTTYPENSIFVLSGYLESHELINTTTIKYNTTGTAPYRQFVIAYDSIEVYTLSFGPTMYMTGEIILYETTNIVETHIQYAPDPSYYANGMSLTGIQNSTATKGWNDSRNWVIIQNEAGRYTPYNSPLPSTPICIVSVDSATGKNMIVWDQPTGVPLDSFLIFRETSQAGVYDQIGAQLGTVFSTFIDTGSYPAVQANRYKLGFRDSCGIASDISANHKTIHLTVNQGVGNTWNLIWDAYEGFTFASYLIYRGTAPDSMTLLTTIASTLYTYTDLTPTTPVYYAIAVVNPS